MNGRVSLNTAYIPADGTLITIHQQQWRMWPDGRVDHLPWTPLCQECGVDHRQRYILGLDDGTS